MSWNFQVLGRNEVFSWSYAAPEPGASEVFEVAGWETGREGIVRGQGVSIQLAGSSEVEYPELGIRGGYEGFAHVNCFSGERNLLPAGVCRSTAGDGLEYLCVLPVSPFESCLDYDILVVTDPAQPFSGAGWDGFIVLDGAFDHGGEAIERLQGGLFRGDARLAGVGMILVVKAEKRPAGRVVPAVPERLHERAARDITKFDARPATAKAVDSLLPVAEERGRRPDPRDPPGR